MQQSRPSALDAQYPNGTVHLTAVDNPASVTEAATDTAARCLVERTHRISSADEVNAWGEHQARSRQATKASEYLLFQKEKNARQGFWEHSEYETFRDALPVDERGPFISGYWTGCRLGEILSLEWPQVDLEGRAVRLRADQTKPGEARIIPLGGPGGDLYDMLVDQQKRHASLCPESPWFFFRQGSKYVDRKSPRRGQREHG